MNIKPILDNLICKPPQAKEEVSDGGIILPAMSAPEKPQMAEVLAAGPGEPNKPTVVKVGDTVIFDRFAAIQVKIDGEDFYLLKERECLAILETVPVD